MRCYLLLLVLASACSSGQTEAEQETTTVKEPAREVYKVEIRDMKFIPDSITVKKGDEVVFVNNDMVTHCITEEKSKAWSSSDIPAGKAFFLIAKESSDYYCAIHTVMKGKIVVK